MKDRETVSISVDKVVKLTALAVLVRIDEDERWIPLSQIEEGDFLAEGDEDIDIDVAKWFAEKEGIA